MFQLTKIDQQLIKSSVAYIEIDGSLPIDGNVEIPGETSSVIPLQFPVKFSTDTKSGNWKTTDIGSYEPMAIFSGSEPRSINLELTYIAVGGAWPGKKIALVERRLKSYFYRNIEGSLNDTPCIKISNLYSSGGFGNISTWRMKSLNIEHGDGIIFDQEEYTAYHLSSKISINLDSYTQVGGRVAEQKPGDSNIVGQLQGNINTIVKQAWY